MCVCAICSLTIIIIIKPCWDWAFYHLNVPFAHTVFQMGNLLCDFFFAAMGAIEMRVKCNSRPNSEQWFLFLTWCTSFYSIASHLTGAHTHERKHAHSVFYLIISSSSDAICLALCLNLFLRIRNCTCYFLEARRWSSTQPIEVCSVRHIWGEENHRITLHTQWRLIVTVPKALVNLHLHTIEYNGARWRRRFWFWWWWRWWCCCSQHITSSSSGQWSSKRASKLHM